MNRKKCINCDNEFDGWHDLCASCKFAIESLEDHTNKSQSLGRITGKPKSKWSIGGKIDIDTKTVWAKITKRFK